MDYFDRIEIMTIFPGPSGSLPREVLRRLGFAVDPGAARLIVTTSQLKILKKQEGWEDEPRDKV